MIGDFILLAWSGFEGGAIGEMFAQWEQLGVFSFILPFLLLFALVFGILNQIKIFQENKAINAVIALVVGIMALQFDFVPRFFADIFPRVGIGLAIILIILILVGMFVDPSKPGIMITLMIVGVIIVVIVLINTAGSMGWSIGYTLQEHWPTIVLVVILLALVIGVIASKSTTQPGYQGFWPSAPSPLKRT